MEIWRQFGKVIIWWSFKPFFTGCYGMKMPPKFVCWKVNPQCSSVEGGILRGCRAPVNGLRSREWERAPYCGNGCVIKLFDFLLLCQTLTFYLPPNLLHLGHAVKSPSDTGAMLLDFLASRNVSNRVDLFVNSPV